MEASIQIRPARPEDVELIFSLIVELAEYEREPDQVTGNTGLLAEALFGEHPVAEALIAELERQPVGFALLYTTFSTWECRPGLWLEDIYVPEQHRRGGIGGRLFAAVAATAVARGCVRLEWVALNWNEPALSFYRKLSAKTLDEWMVHRLEGPPLVAVAQEAGRSPDG